jgi:acyl-coenzyme A synthetase/AMP-(fatty) acid ligase
MGDLGWQDKKGRIWFCGRKSHRVVTKYGTMFTIPCEAIFNTHPLVLRSALVGVGKKPNQIPVMCIELIKKSKLIPKKKLKEELAHLAKQSVLTEKIFAIFFHPNFPVDIRHNSKIFREQLAVWAETKIKKTKHLQGNKI